jgi:hypothetical protein
MENRQPARAAEGEQRGQGARLRPTGGASPRQAEEQGGRTAMSNLECSMINVEVPAQTLAAVRDVPAIQHSATPMLPGREGEAEGQGAEERRRGTAISNLECSMTNVEVRAEVERGRALHSPRGGGDRGSLVRLVLRSSPAGEWSRKRGRVRLTVCCTASCFTVGPCTARYRLRKALVPLCTPGAGYKGTPEPA